MSQNLASQTAIITSLMRWAYTQSDPNPLIKDDFAIQWASEGLKRNLVITLSARINITPPPSMNTDEQLAFILGKTPGYNNVILRTAYTEGKLTEAVEAGIQQYVILGAGLDSFFTRQPFGNNLSIFELDHPASQDFKKKVIQDIGYKLTENTHLIPVNFENDSLLEVLENSKFNTSKPAFFSLLGVTPYLSQNATINLFDSIAKSTISGSKLVFNYLYSDEPRSPRQLNKNETIASFFLPGNIQELLGYNFEIIEDLGAEEINTTNLSALKNFRICLAQRL